LKEKKDESRPRQTNLSGDKQELWKGGNTFSHIRDEDAKKVGSLRRKEKEPRALSAQRWGGPKGEAEGERTTDRRRKERGAQGKEKKKKQEKEKKVDSRRSVGGEGKEEKTALASREDGQRNLCSRKAWGPLQKKWRSESGRIN